VASRRARSLRQGSTNWHSARACLPGFALRCSCDELSEFPFHGRTHRLIGTQTAIWKFKDLSLAEIIRSNQSARSSTGSDNPNVLNSFLPKINSKRVSTFPVALRSSTDVDNSQSAAATVIVVFAVEPWFDYFRPDPISTFRVVLQLGMSFFAAMIFIGIWDATANRWVIGRINKSLRASKIDVDGLLEEMHRDYTAKSARQR